MTVLSLFVCLFVFVSVKCVKLYLCFCLMPLEMLKKLFVNVCRVAKRMGGSRESALTLIITLFLLTFLSTTSLFNHPKFLKFSKDKMYSHVYTEKNCYKIQILTSNTKGRGILQRIGLEILYMQVSLYICQYVCQIGESEC